MGENVFTATGHLHASLAVHSTKSIDLFSAMTIFSCPRITSACMHFWKTTLGFRVFLFTHVWSSAILASPQPVEALLNPVILSENSSRMQFLFLEVSQIFPFIFLVRTMCVQHCWNDTDGNPSKYSYFKIQFVPRSEHPPSLFQKAVILCCIDT